MPSLRVQHYGLVAVATIGLLAAASCFLATSSAAQTIRLAVQKTGTVAWELDVIRKHGLDNKVGLTLETLELASPEAGKIALIGGATDIVVSDWLWVSRERSLGTKLAFYPYSSALGAIMVAQDSSIRNPGDLRGRSLAVAGGPIDKSWLLVQGALRQDGLDLSSQSNIIYGAPPLLAEKALQKEFDATLNYWNFCAALEAKGMRRLVDVAELIRKLGLAGRPAMVGYVFNEAWAKTNQQALTAFLKMVAEAKEILATSDAEWQRIAPLVGTTDPIMLTVYRDRYREGIPRRPISDEEADARILYRMLARLGGRELVGPAPELAPGTFYQSSTGQ